MKSTTIEWNRIVFSQILSLILLFIIIIITVLGNILVITAILKTPKLRNLSNYLILSLSVTDLMVGVLVMPNSAIIDIIYLSEWTFGATFCDIHFLVLSVCTSASSLHLVFIAIDRYLSVTKFKYSLKKKRQHIMAMIFISWFLPLMFALATIIWWRNYSRFLQRIQKGICWVSDDTTRIIISITTKFYMPLVVIITLYILIYKKSVYFIKKYGQNSMNSSLKTIEINKSVKSSEESNSTETTIEAQIERKDTQIRSVKQIRREVKVAKTLAIITIAYIICLLPFNAYVLVNIRSKGYTKLGLDICLWLLFINSSLNPILYAYFNNNFRKAFKNILVSWKMIKL